MSDPVLGKTLPFSAVPFTRLIGLEREYSVNGRSRFVLEEKPELHNMLQSTHGGVLATLLDVAMASAAVSHVNFTMTAVTLGFNCQFLRPGRGRLVAEGELLGGADGFAQCHAQVLDPEGRVVAEAHGSFRYLPHSKE
jgi:uncharacterized protein (TIGR00369 family)